MANKDFISNWDSTLIQIQKALASKSISFGERAGIALDLLEESLKALLSLGCLSKAVVETIASTKEGAKVATRYSLGKKEVEDEEGYLSSEPCIKKTMLIDE